MNEDLTILEADRRDLIVNFLQRTKSVIVKERDGQAWWNILKNRIQGEGEVGMKARRHDGRLMRLTSAFPGSLDDRTERQQGIGDVVDTTE